MSSADVRRVIIAGFEGPCIFWIIAVVTGGLLALMIFSVVKVQTPGFALEQFAKDPRLAGPFSIELTNQGLSHIGPVRTIEAEWRAVTTLIETENLLLIGLVTPGTIRVPKRAFATAEELNTLKSRFVDAISTATRVGW